MMGDAANERFLRYMLLLGEGGQLVLQEVLLREVEKRNQSLKNILVENKNLIKGTIKNKHELQRIFPDETSVNDDVKTWDITLLGLIVIQIFGEKLSSVEIEEVKKIYEKRIRIGARVSITMNEVDYREKRLELSMRLLKLASLTNQGVHYECLDIVSIYGAKPLGLHDMLRQLAFLQEFDEELIENLCSKLQIKIEDIETRFSNSEITNDHQGMYRNSFFRQSKEKQNDPWSESWYFGLLSREETNELFENATTADGMYIVRDCQSTPGNLVLCVKEGARICQYVISRLQVDGTVFYRMGDMEFENMPKLLDFYKTHYLDKTPLTDPVPRKRFVAKCDFDGNDKRDLSIKKGEVLELIGKEDDSWWEVRNKQGTIGIAPKLYLIDIKDGEQLLKAQADESADERSRKLSPTPPVPKRLPAKAVVSKARISSPYNPTQLSLHEGDIVTVTRILGDGHCEGHCKGKTGVFPSMNITFLEDF